MLHVLSCQPRVTVTSCFVIKFSGTHNRSITSVLILSADLINTCDLTIRVSSSVPVVHFSVMSGRSPWVEQVKQRIKNLAQRINTVVPARIEPAATEPPCAFITCLYPIPTTTVCLAKKDSSISFCVIARH